AYKPALAAGKHAILRRTLGSKAIKMVYNEDKSSGAWVRTVDVEADARARFCISDEDVNELARQAVTIEKHYDRPMDIEWGKDGADGKLYILQARPETVQSRTGQVIEKYALAK